MAKKSDKKHGLIFNPYKYPLDYVGLMEYFEHLRVAFDVAGKLHREYGCWVHTGLGKWVSVGLGKNKWFGRVWRLDVGLNPNYLQDEKLFFRLWVDWYSHAPHFLNEYVKDRKNGYRDITTYTIEEVQDAELLERDIRAVLDAELVTGKAWEF